MAGQGADWSNKVKKSKNSRNALCLKFEKITVGIPLLGSLLSKTLQVLL